MKTYANNGLITDNTVKKREKNIKRNLKRLIYCKNKKYEVDKNINKSCTFESIINRDKKL